MSSVQPSKKSGQLNISITPEQVAFIEKLSAHRLTGPELVRGLIDATADFYEKHGWFSFPVVIEPKLFQLQSSAEQVKKMLSLADRSLGETPGDKRDPLTKVMKAQARADKKAQKGRAVP